jgi:hypothetical protein
MFPLGVLGALAVMVFIVSIRLAVKRGYSFVEVISRRPDSVFVQVL